MFSVFFFFQDPVQDSILPKPDYLGKVVSVRFLHCNITVFPFYTLFLKVKVKVKSLSRVRLCDPMDCSLPGSSVHGIFQARILEWVAISVSKKKPDFLKVIFRFALCLKQGVKHCVSPIKF